MSQSGTSSAITRYDEQQTWTPVVVGGTVAGVGTYTLQSGYYTRIGNMIFATFRVSWSAHTGTGDMLINGFPFTCRNSANYDPEGSILVSDINFPASTTYIQGHIGAGTTQFELHGVRDNAADVHVQMDSAGSVHAMVSYLT